MPTAQAVGITAPARNDVSTNKGVALLPGFMNCGEAVGLAKPNE